jgi:hypothetical protein
MRHALVHDESLLEFFTRLVDDALEHQHVSASDLTAYYLVQLLATFAHRDAARAPEGDEPLALRLGRALDSAGAQQRVALRQVGDLSLFVSGYFADSLGGRIVDLDYYASLGGYAYGSLSVKDDDALAPVYGELAERFVTFADVLSEVSSQSALSSDSDLLRLYERWARGGSRRSGELLVKRGILPVPTVGRARVQ